MTLLLEKAQKKIKQLIRDGIFEKNYIKHIDISDKPDKKLKAILNNGKIVHFGSKNSITFLEGADKQKRDAYQKRASKIKNKQGKFTFKIPLTANYLSYNILWT